MKETISEDFKKLMKVLSFKEVARNHNLRRKMRKIEKMLGQLDVFISNNQKPLSGGLNLCKN